MPYLLTPLAQEDYDALLYSLALRAGTWRWSIELEEKLLDAFDLIAANPGLGHLRQDLLPRSIYFFNVEPYQILYLRDTDTLKVIAILHAARDIATLMQDR
jgi:plasmid stabilization system protein ParE